MSNAASLPTQEASNEPSTRRREILAALLGIVGASSVTACVPTGNAGAAPDSVASALFDGTIKSANSVTELRGVKAGAGALAILLGYSAPGDGGGGVFYWDAGAAKDDGGTSLNDGRLESSGWRRIYDGALNVRWFGAMGRGKDDRESIQAAIAAAVRTGGRVFCPAGTYLLAGKGARSALTDGINITASDLEIFGDDSATVFKQGNDSQYILSINRYNGGTSDPKDNVRGIKIRGIRFVGPDNRTDPIAAGNEHVHMLNIHAASNVLIERCAFIGFQGDGIYLGSGNSGADERHNVDITIRDCLFDGIDNNNRNGVSIIDGDGVLITGCSFRSCTSSKMPGCIDIEPNGNTFHRIRNIQVVNNRFSGCKGNVGNVGFVLRAAVYKQQPSGFVISGNSFDGNRGVVFLNGAAPYSPDASFQIAVTGNSGITSCLLYCTGYTRGLTVSANNVAATSISILGETVADCAITGNTLTGGGVALGVSLRSATNLVLSNNTLSQFKDAAIELGESAADKSTGCVLSGNAIQGGKIAKGILVRNGSDISMSGNLFVECMNDAIELGCAGSSLARISVIGNIFRDTSARGYSVASWAGIDGTHCVYMNNVHDGHHVFPAWRTDMPGGFVGAAQHTSYAANTLPDAFPVGVHTSLINGDTDVPLEGGRQGTLITYRGSILPAYEKWTNQLFYHANNTTGLGSFYLRRRASGVNAWTSWYKVTGI